jgi:hypothetical protein
MGSTRPSSRSRWSSKAVQTTLVLPRQLRASHKISSDLRVLMAPSTQGSAPLTGHDSAGGTVNLWGPTSLGSSAAHPPISSYAGFSNSLLRNAFRGSGRISKGGNSRNPERQ